MTIGVAGKNHFGTDIIADDNTLPLALNIKADGLQIKLKELIWYVCSWWTWISKTKYKRESEYEKIPSFYDEAYGIWHWITKEVIEICIVSPDLHKREYKKEWQHYKDIEIAKE